MFPLGCRFQMMVNTLRSPIRISRYFSTTYCLKEAAFEYGHNSRRFLAGIKPSGSIHLGNYLGTIQRCNAIKNNREPLSICIADMHSLASSDDPVALRSNIFNTAAALYASGLDPNVATVFVQSSVPEHMELSWILACHTGMSRLAQIPEFQERTRKTKDMKMGLFTYPILQTADVILHRATHVPVGEDQVPNLNFAQSLIQSLNDDYGLRIPICQAYIERYEAGKIRSLKEPTKKMSKSDMNTKGSIYLTDSDEDIMDKFKKCATDCISDIAYDPTMRPGISNLLSIYSLVNDKPIKDVIKEVGSLDGTRFKTLVGEAVVEHLRPIRERMYIFLQNQQEVIMALEEGAEKARKEAQPILRDLKERLGLGAVRGIPEPIKVKPISLLTRESGKKNEMLTRKPPSDTPIVPIQKLRVEKRLDASAARTASSMSSTNFDGVTFAAQNSPDYASPAAKLKFGEKRYRNKY